MILTALALVCLYAPTKPIPMQVVTDRAAGISMQIPRRWYHNKTEARKNKHVFMAYEIDKHLLTVSRTRTLFAGAFSFEGYQEQFDAYPDIAVISAEIHQLQGHNLYQINLKETSSEGTFDHRTLLFGIPGRTFAMTIFSPWENHEETTQILNIILSKLEYQQDPNLKANNKLVEALEQGDMRQLKRALKAGADPNLYLYGRYVLEQALDRDQLDLAKPLLEAGAYLNFVGFTALMSSLDKSDHIKLLDAYDPEVVARIERYMPAFSLKAPGNDMLTQVSNTPNTTSIPMFDGTMMLIDASDPAEAIAKIDRGEVRYQPRPSYSQSENQMNQMVFKCIEDGTVNLFEHYLRRGEVRVKIHPESGLTPLAYCDQVIANLRAQGKPVEAHLKIRELLAEAQ